MVVGGILRKNNSKRGAFGGKLYNCRRNAPEICDIFDKKLK
jgi:hypothetical protein